MADYKVLTTGMNSLKDDIYMFSNIDDALKEIDKYEDLRDDTRRHIIEWAEECKPGSLFSTNISAVVKLGASSVHWEYDSCRHCKEQHMHYGEYVFVRESGNLEQKVSCPHCNRQWVEIFAIIDHREIEEPKKEGVAPSLGFS